jgi:peptide-methionine (R)-S-oxide reductase
MTKKQVSEEEWKERLTPEQYAVCREKGTEASFVGGYTKFHDNGIYQ